MYAFAEIYSACKINANSSKLAICLSGHNYHCWNHVMDSDEEDEEEAGRLPVSPDNDVIRCYAYVQESGFCVLANTCRAYCEANRQVWRMYLCLLGCSVFVLWVALCLFCCSTCVFFCVLSVSVTSCVTCLLYLCLLIAVFLLLFHSLFFFFLFFFWLLCLFCHCLPCLFFHVCL